MTHQLVLAAAFLISSVSAYYSVVGLTTLFPGALVPIVVMGISLEVGKIVTASYLYSNWKNIGGILRSYLLGAVIVLMIVSSMGVFGFLSRAHVERRIQQEASSGASVEVIETRVAQKRSVIEDLDKKISVIDDSIRGLINTKRSSGALRASENFKKTRDELSSRREQENSELSKILEERSRVISQNKLAEIEVGPLKFVAELIFGASDPSLLERSVRYLIVTIVAVLDPLAIALFFVASGYKRREKLVVHDDGKIHVDPSNIHSFSAEEITARPREVTSAKELPEKKQSVEKGKGIKNGRRKRAAKKASEKH